jgi:hypothetical protein
MGQPGTALFIQPISIYGTLLITTEVRVYIGVVTRRTSDMLPFNIHCKKMEKGRV